MNDDLIDCSKCGVVFNYKTASYELREDYPYGKVYHFKCPVCKKEDSK